MGVFQLIAGLRLLDPLMQYVSCSVIPGFVKALAIMIFLAQMPQLLHAPPEIYLIVAAGHAIIYLFPYLTKAVPSPLVAIVILTIVMIYGGIHINTVGDMGKLPASLPYFALPHATFTNETLRIIFPFSLMMPAAGLLESMLTAQIIDDFTDTPSNKAREMLGQNVANYVTGFLGGMGGCAMIGQSVINVKSGGRDRLSTFVAGGFLLFLLGVLNPLVAKIPMPSLVAVMIMVSIGAFSWRSVRDLGRDPRQSSIVMVATVVTVVWSDNLAAGVLAGVLLSGLFFASKARRLFMVSSTLSGDGRTRTYRVSGEVFFASAERLPRHSTSRKSSIVS